ncbi:MAG: GNAT family N-acetyltransferase [Spirochaetaceae bacterium]
MLWQRVNSTISKTLGHFVLENERFNISLVSRLREKKNSLLPFSDNSILYVGYPRSSRHNSVSDSREESLPPDIRPVALVMLTLRGSLFPLFSPHYSIEPEEVACVLRRILPGSKPLFSVIGTERDVNLCRPFLSREEDTSLSYHLMTRRKELPLPISRAKQNYKIKNLTPKNCRRVFPLEEMYQHEEVLIHPENFNPAAHMIYFKRAASSQHILFAEGPDGPIAKAGTNSIGFRYCQIGGVYTLPAYRRRGISRDLMINLLQWSSRSGLSAALFVQKNNRPAVELYRNLSFDLEEGYRIVYLKQA